VGEHYTKLIELLREDQDFRESFRSDPKGSLERAGIPESAINPYILDTLAGLSSPELEVIARVRTRLGDFDIPDDDILEMF
jgi:hypothetical protein